jgi:hypothetical protein
MAQDRYQPKNYQIAIFGYAFLAFAALLCQQTGGQFRHGIGCNICPELPVNVSFTVFCLFFFDGEIDTE